jgi:hypothetical protein
MKTLSARGFESHAHNEDARPELASSQVPADDMWSAPSEHTSVLEQSQSMPVAFANPGAGTSSTRR